MRKSIIQIAVILFVFGGVLTGCSSSADKVEEAQKNVQSATKDLNEANKEFIADVQNYKKETDDKIVANDHRIAEFKATVEHEKKEAKAEYQKKIDELSQKNSDLKKLLDDYKDDGKENWEKFKTEFNHNMDELNKSFKDLAAKNTK